MPRKNPLHHLIRSFTSVDYYRGFGNVPFKLSFKVFVVYCLIFALVVTLFCTIKYRSFSSLFAAVPTALTETYPDGLEISIVNGEVATNSYEPLFLKMGINKNILGAVARSVGESPPFSEEQENSDEEPFYFNLLAIDTRAAIANVDHFSEYDSFALLTKNSLIVHGKRGELRVFSLDNISNSVIDKPMVMEWIDTLRPFLDHAWLTITLGIFCVNFVINMVIYPVYLLVVALILFLITKLLGNPRSYKMSYQVGLHLAMITCSLDGLFLLIGFPWSIPYAETLALCVLGVLTLQTIELETVVSESVTEGKKHPRQLLLETLYSLNNVLEIQKILTHNKDLIRGFQGDSPLLHYAEQGNPGLVLYILQLGADVHFKNKNCETALHIAAREGHTNVVNVLLDNHANINAETPRGAQPIHFASIFGHKQLAQHLVTRGARVDFITAVSLGDFVTVKTFIENDKSYVNLFSPAVGCNPLHCAVMEQNPKMVELLLDNGARPDATDDEQLTPLIYAIRIGNTPMVKNLLKKGANKTLKDGLGHDAFWWARQVGNQEIFKILETA